MKRVHVIATGGTIASKTDAATGAARPVLTVQDLVAALPGLGSVAEVTFEQFANVASQALSFDQFLAIARRIKAIRERQEADGVVLTQGTMTMEESSYLWDLVLERAGAVIVTGAMRHSSLPSGDGPRNLLDAVIAASSDATTRLGVVVCMNSELHAARNVVKFHSQNVESFRSPDIGPVGFVRNGRVDLHRFPSEAHEPIPVGAITAKVALVPVVVGDDGSLMEAALAAGADGLVLQLMGGGAVPPACIPVIVKALVRVPVIGVSRCPTGSMYENVYSFEGGDKQLRELGVIFAGSLTGLKARIKLILFLSTHPRPAGGLAVGGPAAAWRSQLARAFPNI
jgi:L-asparaginase